MFLLLMKNLTRDSVQDPAPEPNPEQTTPLLSLAFYNFLDPVVFKAYRTPHLPISELPPLADYDHGKNLVKRGFKVIYHAKVYALKTQS